MISRDVAELILLIRKLDVAAHQGPRSVEQETWVRIRTLLETFPAPKVEPKKESK